MNYDIASLKRKLLIKYPFFGSILAKVEYKEVKSIETAGTDEKTIYYNPDFLNSLIVEKQLFTLAHEVSHIAFNHIERSEGKDPEIWNYACDAVVNQFLKRDGLPLVDGAIDMPDAINYDVETLYEKLLEEKEKSDNSSQEKDKNNQEQNGSGMGSSSSSTDNQDGKEKEDNQNQNVGHDNHSLWKKAIEKKKKEEEVSKKISPKEKSEVDKKKEELEGMGEKEAFNKNKEEKRKQLEDLKKSISKEASRAGNTTNADRRYVNNIGKSKPLIDWRYVLKETTNFQLDWTYKNATIENGVVTPHLEEIPTPETEIVLDTSGSIDETLLKNFLRECKNILNHSLLKVGCFDTKFYGFHDIRSEKDIENMKFEGGGGTDFDVAVNAFTKRVDNKIIFTDGYSSMPSSPCDAIWIVFSNTTINPKGGKVIHITPDELDKLYSRGRRR